MVLALALVLVLGACVGVFCMHGSEVLSTACVEETTRAATREAIVGPVVLAHKSCDIKRCRYPQGLCATWYDISSVHEYLNDE